YSDFYRAIYRCNTVLESFEIVELSEAEQTRIEAEARFIRAICHWSLVKLYAQPYNYTANNSHLGIVIREEAAQDPLPRNTVSEVYESVINDFTFAYNNLPEMNGVYASKYSAAGYLAHVYFLMNNLQNAESFASVVIGSGQFALDPDLDRYEQDNLNTEMVFGIVSLSNDFRNDGFSNNFRSDIGTPVLTMSEEFFNLMASNPADDRNNWVSNINGDYACNRFNGKNYFNVPLVHLSGLHLIRAEAIANGFGTLQTAIDDVNLIRSRAFGEGINQLPDNSSAEQIIEAARIELRKETMCEGTWIDYLKRRGTLGEDIIIRDAPWSCPGMALQFPNGETSVQGFELNPEGGC
ncbi:MAG: RagB/SusD family nutrient uptake outer membrane protein, partial [Flavobacteriales bacterium]